MSVVGWIKTIAVLEVLCVILWPGAWLLSYDVFFQWSASPLLVRVFAVEGVVFLAAAVLGAVGAFRNRRWAVYPLVLFPFLAFIHGISVVPYLARVAPIGNWRSLVILVINAGVVFALLRMRKAYAAAVA